MNPIRQAMKLIYDARLNSCFTDGRVTNKALWLYLVNAENHLQPIADALDAEQFSSQFRLDKEPREVHNVTA